MASVLVILILIIGCNKGKSNDNVKVDATVAVKDSAVETIWEVKARLPMGGVLDVKAIDSDGNTYDVKAVQNSDQISLVDIKAFVKGNSLPIKIPVSDDKYMPVKAIDTDGTIIDIKAFTADGQILDVKGVEQSGNIIHIKAINSKGEFYNIEAISPKGWINDVKGIKMLDSPVEMTINGVDIFAHVKSIPQLN
jgi:hypothetical protein